MNPPTGGPTTGPSTAGTVRYDIAVTSSDLAMVFRTIRRPTGTIMAPPKPCKIREATNSGSAGSAVEMTVASSISMNSAQPTIIGARNSSGEILEGLGLIATDQT